MKINHELKQCQLEIKTSQPRGVWGVSPGKNLKCECTTMRCGTISDQFPYKNFYVLKRDFRDFGTNS
jgi:hypothetical protein